MFRPREAATRSIGSRPRHVWAVFVLWNIALIVAILVLQLWSDTHWSSTQYTTLVGTGTTFSRVQEETRSLGETWRFWLRSPMYGPLGWVVLLCPTIVIVGTTVLTWLHLADAHDVGTVRDTFRRVFRAVAIVIGPVTLLAAACWCVVVWAQIDSTSRYILGIPSEVVAIILTAAAVLMVIVWLSKAVPAARSEVGTNDPGPRCEGCGYDLTHVPDSGLCPECGMVAATSLTPGIRRAACRWESTNRWSFASSFETTWEVLFHPTRFYARLPARGPDGAARRFAICQFLCIALCAAIWILILVPSAGGPTRDIPAIMCAVSAYVTLAGWGLWRIVSATSATWWYVGQELPEPRWGRKVVMYETAYLWAFCIFNGSIITTMVMLAHWFGARVFQNTQMRYLVNTPLGPLGMLGGEIALIGLYLWRFRIAMRAIRWANF